jgi:hypothetical protein
MSYRIGDTVYSPQGGVVVIECDDELQQVSCISVCSRFVYSFDFKDIALMCSEIGATVLCTEEYKKGDVITFMKEKRITVGIVFSVYNKNMFNIVQMCQDKDGTAIGGVTTEVLLGKKQILGHACFLVQSLFRLRWNDLKTKDVVSSFKAAQRSPPARNAQASESHDEVTSDDEVDDPVDYYENAWKHLQMFI